MKTKITTSRKLLLGTILALATPFALPTAVRAADHGDGPSAALDRACDIGDTYFFMDPTDATKTHVIILATVQGFIVPSEANNFSVFDPNVRYQFQIENNGDAILDKTISVFFNPRVAPTSTPQGARIVFSGDPTVYTANATNPTLAGTANTQTVTTLANGVEFFAGEVDDPFFFDIVGFNRFVAKKIANNPTAANELTRARDSFAGYNTLCIGVRVPIALLKATGSTSTKLGLNFVTQRRLIETPSLVGTTLASGPFRNIDREGNPAVNVALVPFAKKNRYNASVPAQDKANLFSSDIIATLTALGASQSAIGTLASVAVAQGDILRLDTAIANTGNGGGNNAGAGFPNGRRPQDDVIDTILGIIAGGTLGDGVNANDVPFQDVFPYVALPQQPRANGVTDDNTRN